MDKKPENKVKLLSDDSLDSQNINGDSGDIEMNDLAKIPKTSLKNPKTSSFVVSETPLQEAKIMINIVLLIAFSLIFEFCPQIIANIMVGHYYDSEMLDDEYLSGMGLANTFLFITAVAITWGFTTALYTLVPQAVGHDDEEEANIALRIHTQRAFLVTTSIAVPLYLIQFFSGKVMVAIGEPDYLEKIIQNYTYTLMPYILGVTWLTILQRICQSLEFNAYLSVVTFLGAACSYPIMYIFMNFFDDKYLGTGIAQSVIVWCMFLAVLIYLIKKGYGFLFYPLLPLSVVANKDGVKEYIKLCLPGLFQNGFEWWVLEIAIILAGYIGYSDDSEERTTAISTAVIMYNLFLVSISFGFGIGNAVNIRAAKYVGRGEIELAKMATRLGFYISVVICILFIALLSGFSSVIPEIWTHNPDTDSLAAKVCNVFAFFAVMLLQSQYFGGLYRAIGYQKVSAVFVVIGYYVLCLPTLFIVLFGAEWRRQLVLGSVTIWVGLGGGNMFASVACGIYFLYKIHWEDAVGHAQTRMRETMSEMSMSDAGRSSKGSFSVSRNADDIEIQDDMAYTTMQGGDNDNEDDAKVPK